MKNLQEIVATQKEGKFANMKHLKEYIKLSCNIIIDDVFENYHTYQNQFKLLDQKQHH